MVRGIERQLITGTPRKNGEYEGNAQDTINGDQAPMYRTPSLRHALQFGASEFARASRKIRWRTAIEGCLPRDICFVHAGDFRQLIHFRSPLFAMCEVHSFRLPPEPLRAARREKASDRLIFRRGSELCQPVCLSTMPARANGCYSFGLSSIAPCWDVWFFERQVRLR
jgi:hypothetical protein